jgi:hypothetical protein
LSLLFFGVALSVSLNKRPSFEKSGSSSSTTLTPNPLSRM